MAERSASIWRMRLWSPGKTGWRGSGSLTCEPACCAATGLAGTGGRDIRLTMLGSGTSDQAMDCIMKGAALTVLAFACSGAAASENGRSPMVLAPPPRHQTILRGSCCSSSKGLFHLAFLLRDVNRTSLTLDARGMTICSSLNTHFFAWRGQHA